MDRIDHYESEVTIGVVGKYVGLPDAYKSLREAWSTAASPTATKVNIQWIDAELFEHPEADIVAELEPLHGILVPGGFGERGSEGKIASVKFAREREIPFFGICLGMQMACIEGARNTAGISEASTTEFGETSEPVVGLITEWMSEEGLQQRAAGGDLAARCGSAPIQPSSTATASSAASTAGPRSASATATATRSTSITATRWRRAGWSSPACRPTASCPRSSSGPTTPGSSASSSIPS